MATYFKTFHADKKATSLANFLMAMLLLCLLTACKDMSNGDVADAGGLPLGEPIAYCAYNEKTFIIPVEKGAVTASDLPDGLVIKPGFYRVENKVFNLSHEGVCRIIVPGERNYQRIVYKDNIKRLMSGIAWMATHGNADDDLGYEAQAEKALTSKLVLTCGVITTFAGNLLNSLSIPNRLVMSLTLDEWNNYDNGHTMIEVYANDKWTVYDLDQNAMPKTKSEQPMSFLEFANATKEGDYTIEKIADDSSVDAASFNSRDGYNYGFYSELASNNLKRWYKRVVQAPFIRGESGSLYFYDEASKERILSYSSDFKYIPEDRFMNKFYNKNTER